MKKLSRRQRHIYEFIRKQISERGVPPSIREIGEAVSLRSCSTVHSHLRSIESKGYIERDRSKPRSIRLCEANPNRLALLETEIKVLRHAMESALANPHAWRETLESALCPAPAGALEAA